MSEIVKFYLCSSLKKSNKEVELTKKAGAVERNGIERWLDRYRREGERSEEFVEIAISISCGEKRLRLDTTMLPLFLYSFCHM